MRLDPRIYAGGAPHLSEDERKSTRNSSLCTATVVNNDSLTIASWWLRTGIGEHLRHKRLMEDALSRIHREIFSEMPYLIFVQ